ncbi:bifunctional UDP-N-acetylglucosamine diphosphorylase/glucosamine-1-phosphate N-acetyltransferase GlmU [Candidatus Dependentiae bacterium]
MAKSRLREELQAVVLSAGKSTRFKTGNTKLIEKICGRPMILYPAKLLEDLGIDTCFVVGYQKEIIKKIVSQHATNNISFVHQKEQLGTGHAVACTKDLWDKPHVLILNGDVPLITPQIIENLYTKHVKADAAISFVASHYTGTDHAYGRVIQDKDGIKIVEAKDFKQEVYDNKCCINAGIYIAKTEFLKNCINKIKTKNASKEFYLTDLVQIACKKNLNIVTFYAPFDRVRGINTFQELWAAEQIKRSEIIKYWMSHGVKFSLAQNIHIDIDAQIEAGTNIGCGVHILSGSKIGKNCNIRKFSTIENTVLQEGVQIFPNTIIRDSHIGKNAKIGPFAHVHTQSHIEQEVEIGNFVEIKKSTIGKNSYAKHLAYLGNTEVGSMVNIGAGTITCNYDGFAKHPTIIKNNVFIGSNNTLVAPVTIGQNAFTAAGSTITENVDANSLAIGRAKQVNKENYVQKLLDKLRLRSQEITNKDSQTKKTTKTTCECKPETKNKTQKEL